MSIKLGNGALITGCKVADPTPYNVTNKKNELFKYRATQCNDNNDRFAYSQVSKGIKTTKIYDEKRNIVTIFTKPVNAPKKQDPIKKVITGVTKQQFNDGSWKLKY